MDQTTLLFFGKSGGSSPAVLDTLNVTANGTYTPPSGTDGYNEVNVNVTPALETLSATSNGSYSPSAGKDGFSSVTVAVVPELETKSITTNGTYTPSTGKDGFSSVTVNVPSSQVPFTPSSLTNLNNLFSTLTVDANGQIETNNNTGMSHYAFKNLSSRSFDEVVDITGMFAGFDFNNLDASNITINSRYDSGLTTRWTFAYCRLNGMPPVTIDKIGQAARMFYYSYFTNSFNVTDVLYLANGIYVSNMFESNSTNNLRQVFKLKPCTGMESSFMRMAANNVFSGCQHLRSVENFLDVSDIIINKSSGECNGFFRFCYSLRQLPSWYNRFFTSERDSSYISHYSSVYYNEFYQNYVLDEIQNLPVITYNASSSSVVSNNLFNNSFANNHRVKDMVFETNNGTPYVAKWKNQIIDLNYCVGYASDEGRILNYNSGITQDKKVTSQSTYQELKNDPDWYTTDVNYSRYNHTSAVNTINSLPDCSATGTNTIKFEGQSGTNTDGGAISNLTSAEIAVAAAKGWTVTIQ